jgi:hypothetical protein
MVGYARHLFQLHHDTQRIIAEHRCQLVSHAKEVKGLTQEVGVMRQQVRDLESHLHDKEEALLSSLYRSFERYQELLWHRVLLRTAEESTKLKAREFEEFLTAKDLEIQGMQKELEELEEEVQDRVVALTNRDNIINNLQADIHEL